jgi:hypothetical protein
MDRMSSRFFVLEAFGEGCAFTKGGFNFVFLFGQVKDGRYAPAASRSASGVSLTCPIRGGQQDDARPFKRV